MQDVQVVFQGGGARVAALLAAAQALRKAEDDGLIRVTRVAGASAGAIAAALFAERHHNLEDVRAHFAEMGDAAISALFPAKGTRKLLWHAVWGHSVYDQTKLSDLLSKFIDPSKTIDQLGDPPAPKVDAPALPATAQEVAEVAEKIKVYIAVSHVSTRKADMLSGQHNAMDALMHSSALPFVFRSVKNLSGGGKSLFLDGGICDNLPASILLKDTGKYGPVIAFSFNEGARKGPFPDNIVQLGRLVFELAVDSSVNRAYFDIGKDSICPINTELTTFDFRQICSLGFKSEKAKAIQDSTTTWLKGWCARQALKNNADAQIAAAVAQERARGHEALCQIGDATKALSTNVRIKKSTMVVFARSLEHRALEETVQHEVELEPTEGITAFGLSAGSSTATDIPTGNLEIFDKNNRRLDFFPVNCRDRDKSKDHRLLAFFFKTQLEPNSTYLIRRSFNIGKILEKLHTEKSDWLSSTNEKLVNAEALEIVVLLPETSVTSVNFIPRGPAFHDEHTAVGSVVESVEINPSELRKRFQREMNTYPSYAIRGWRASDVPPNKRIRIDLRRTAN